MDQRVKKIIKNTPSPKRQPQIGAAFASYVDQGIRVWNLTIKNIMSYLL